MRPFRNTCILGLAALGTILAAVGGWRYARASAPVNGPIILISIDTLRADHLPPYGYRHVNTPAIDALAADGIVFERAYSHAPETLPAHVALLSGRLPFETGVRDNAGFAVKSTERLLPQLLHDRGYATAGIVSSFLLRRETGIGQGFDFFDSDLSTSPRVVRRDGSDSEAIAERWLGEQQSSRLFLFLHLYEPHAPYLPPPQFAHYAPYDATVAYADDIVGRLIKYLKAHQLYDRSTILLVSDHGEGLGDHGEQAHGLFLYDETIHIPLIVKQAAGVGAGRRVADVVQHIDLVPTILDLVKAPSPGNLRGRSLKPLLDESGELPEAAVYSEALDGYYHFGSSELTALTDARYRYIRASREELYDLQRDPHERENLIGSVGNASASLSRASAGTNSVSTSESGGDAGAARLKRARAGLRAALAALMADAKMPPPAPIAPEDRERFLALGYVSAVGSASASNDDSTPPPASAVAPGSSRSLVVPTQGAFSDPYEIRQVVETYRSAVALGAERRWDHALSLLQGLVRQSPDMPDAWAQIATFATSLNRCEQAAEAYRHLIGLRPSDPDGYLGSAAVLLKLHRLSEAREAAETIPRVAAEDDMRSRALGHALLSLIALARHDADGAREEAQLAQATDPAMPMPDYIEARLLYDQGQYEEALPFFEEAATTVKQSHATPIPELHFYAAETLTHLERYWDAEGEYLDEIRDFPENVRARVGLATAYQAMDRLDEAGAIVTGMIQASPAPETYAAAARLWKGLGDSRQAEAVRTEARRMFAEPDLARVRLGDFERGTGTAATKGVEGGGTKGVVGPAATKGAGTAPHATGIARPVGPARSADAPRLRRGGGQP